jgi:monooxygenase
MTALERVAAVLVWVAVVLPQQAAHCRSHRHHIRQEQGRPAMPSPVLFQSASDTPLIVLLFPYNAKADKVLLTCSIEAIDKRATQGAHLPLTESMKVGAMAEEFDVIVVGSGISGVSAGCHLKMDAPDRSFVILEGRERRGGTWDLFRYPGIRSDSDMHTLGFAFKPWTHEKSIADAPAILDYLDETIAEYGLGQHIRYQHRVTQIAWDSEAARWTISVQRGEGEEVQMRCRFLHMCTGYYSYTEPYQPDFPGKADFEGAVFHPQFWPDNLDYQGKQVVVIGSGATAVTIVPAMVQSGAGHVTMLQRSPSYLTARPAKDAFANRLRKVLPNTLAYKITRFKNINMQAYFYNLTQRKPQKVRDQLIELTKKELPQGYDIATHFTPKYNPWEQRLCLVPDADFFQGIREGKTEVVTDHIERFTKTGILLKSGRELEADIIVTATGLKMEIMSGVEMLIDGEPVRVGQTFSYKGCMYSNVPNLASSFGYSNASWTLKADLISAYVCRLLNHMRDTKTDVVVAEPRGVKEHEEGMMNLSSGYVQRAKGLVPMQGDIDPWIVHHDYGADKKLMRYGKLEDGALHFYAQGRWSHPARAPHAVEDLAIAAE